MAAFKAARIINNASSLCSHISSSSLLFTMPNSLLLQLSFISLLSTIICTTNFIYAYSQCLDDEQTLLLELKNELILDPYYSEKKLVQWNQTDDCCSWKGVECGGAGHVIGLQLDSEGISGGLDENSSSLFSLRYLKKLNLAFNYFNGTQIPRGIGNLTHLTHLNLTYARFGGQVPVELSLLRRLVNLDISGNDFNGTQIPKGIGDLTHLTHLNLADAGFGGQVPVELSLLRRLVSLDISGNWRIQPRNEHWNLMMFLQNLTSFRELYLDGIDISFLGSKWCQVISSSLPHLRILSLGYCSLTGPPNPSLLQLQSLSILRLDGCYNLSAVPSFFANFSNLTTLSLQSCSLKGSFPEIIFHMPTLQELDLSGNELLNGTLPQFPQSSTLRSISISSCKFTGPIPPTLAKLTELEHVDLSNNIFTGFIPPFYMSEKLTYISLSHNSLIGSLSSMHFGRLPKLSHIYLGHNSLNGSIPSYLFGLPSLDTLWLNNNQFIGTFQLEKIQRLRNLTSLDLSHNNLSVDASSTNSSPSTFPQLVWLGLASCNLHSFPDFIKQSRLLLFLDLSNNRIAGEIPSWIWEIGNGKLSYLNLSSNLLVGLQKPYIISSYLNFLDLHSNLLQDELLVPFPPYTSNVTPQLSFLSLANNNLSGSIPTSLCNAISYLEVVDLSFNDLSGNIPPCLIENNENLQVLNLGRNNISDDIPDKFSVNCGLEMLDLSNNNLQGKIPKSLVNCRRLVALNVGNNSINDSFPCMMPSSFRLLVLRSNRFHGELRCHKRWPNLQIIDIASNNFVGSLYPISFSSWRGMMPDSNVQLMRTGLHSYFVARSNDYQDEVTLIIKGSQLKLVKIRGDFTFIDFSCNNFQGTIPDAIGDLSSLVYLNLSHNALTGAIPKSLGKLRQLESLDLSVNQLTGTIPMEVAGLTFLQVLNLSYNKLVGEIPNGPQFHTFPPTFFEGNTGLCGKPVNISCNNDPSPPKQENVESHGKTEIEWDYVSAALGYVVGLGSFSWVFLYCGNLRERYFEKVDEVLDKIFDCRDRKRRHGRRRRALWNQVRRQ